MKYIFELNHPKHYYQFKFIIQKLTDKNHDVLILARDKDVLLNVLKEENIDFKVFGEHKKSLFGKIFNTFFLLNSYFKIAKDFRPDYVISKASLYGSIIAKILKAKSVIFPDSELVFLTNKIVVPLCSYVVTPATFTLNYGKKHIKVPGFFEDSYLSPLVFKKDKALISPYLQFPYVILRFVAWDANHDINKGGFSYDEKVELVKALSEYADIYISSEKKLPKELEKYQLNTPKSLIHHVLSYATLYVGDSQTMATEAALLGVPAIRSNEFVGENDMSNFIVLEKTYGLLKNLKSFKDVLELAVDYVKTSRKNEWEEKLSLYQNQVGDLNSHIIELLMDL